MRLGGWHRLFIVAAVLWALFIVGAAIDELGSIAEREKESWPLAAARVRLDMEQDSAYKARILAPNPFIDIFDSALVRAAGMEYLQASLDGFAKERADLRKMALLFWLGPTLGVLGLGYAVAWIREGFSSRRAPSG